MNRTNKLSLKNLRLKNVATFENQEITFDHGLNAIVGETGSGKSLILEALGLILGQRADKKIIRKNSPFALVEATFHAHGPEIESFFTELGFPFDQHEIIIKRIVYPVESSKSYLNLQLCSLNELNLFAKKFIDLVGQFDNQKLRTEEYQLLMLDSYGKISDLTEKYRTKYFEWQETKEKLSQLKNDQSARKQREDYLRFQTQEIETFGPTPEDEISLIEKKNCYQSLEKRKLVIQSALTALLEDEQNNVLSLLKNTLNSLRKDPSLIPEELTIRLQDAHQLVEDITFDLTKQLNFEFSDSDLEKILDRLDFYQKLKTKFGGNVETVLKRFLSFKKELTELENLEEDLEGQEALLNRLESEINQLGRDIHQKRMKVAVQLSTQLTSMIQQLKMKGASVDIRLTPAPAPRLNGLDQLEFMVETNAGDGFYRLNEIISGGELSRILLAFRQVLSANDSISIFFFDEIDSGIGGETALAVGKALQDVAHHSQVMAITHLPQLAHYADRLIEVSKITQKTLDGHKTTSKVKEISGEDKQDHVRSMNPL